MTIELHPVCAAQGAWEAARSSRETWHVIFGSSDPVRVGQLVTAAAGDSWRWCGAVHHGIRRRIFPAHVLGSAARNSTNATVVTLAATHPACPADVAAATFSAEHAVLASQLTFLPAEALAVAADAALRQRDGSLADLVAVAHNGPVLDVASHAVRFWLAERSAGALPSDGELLCAIGLRDDLSDGELAEVLRRLSASSTRLLRLVRLRPFAVSQLAAILPFAAQLPSWPSGGALSVLLSQLPAADRLPLLERVAQLGLWEASMASEVVASTVFDELTVDALSRLFSTAGAELEPLLCDVTQLSAPLPTLFRMLASAPRALGQLDSEGLALFVQLAPRWAGSLGDLLGVIARS